MSDKLRQVKEEDLASIKLIDRSTLLKMWPIRPETLSRWTHSKDESKRIPCYMFGDKPLFSIAEIRYWMDTRRYTPKRKVNK